MRRDSQQCRSQLRSRPSATPYPVGDGLAERGGDRLDLGLHGLADQLWNEVSPIQAASWIHHDRVVVILQNPVAKQGLARLEDTAAAHDVVAAGPALFLVVLLLRDLYRHLGERTGAVHEDRLLEVGAANADTYLRVRDRREHADVAALPGSLLDAVGAVPVRPRLGGDLLGGRLHQLHRLPGGRVERLA